LALYLAGVILLGALIAPILFWSAQTLARHDRLTFLGQFDFEQFFHRALLISALAFLWPLLRSLDVRRPSDLGLKPNPHRWQDAAKGFLIALLPLALCGGALIAAHVYSLRGSVAWGPMFRTVTASILVPFIEEAFFRSLVLGILLRSGYKLLSIFLTSALFSVVHFLKAPEGTSAVVTWCSGFRSIAHAFVQFSNPVLVLAGFTTLFLIGWILADSRVRTASLWLPIGLHAGWIFGNGVFNRVARREMIMLPWLGRNLLVGFIPLAVLGLTWIVVRMMMKRNQRHAL